jgi:hypothetical protein
MNDCPWKNTSKSYDAFNELKDVLQPILYRNAKMCRDAEPILTEHVIAMGLRYLAGGRVVDNRRFIGMGSCTTLFSSMTLLLQDHSG